MCRCEIDMENIKKKFHSKYNEKLCEHIKVIFVFNLAECNKHIKALKVFRLTIEKNFWLLWQNSFDADCRKKYN